MEPPRTEGPPREQPPPRRRLRTALRLAVLLTALWLLGSYLVAYGLTRRPRPWFAEPAPSVAWGKLEPHRLTTRDGHELGAWLAEGAAEAPSVLLLHGNGGSRKNCLDHAELLARAGCTVLLLTLRAHGDSTGEFNDIGYSARHDVVAAVEFLERRRPGRPIVVLGTSLGAAAAVFAARELGHRVSGYVLECLYRDLKTAVWNRTENALPPGLDWICYQGLLLVSPLVLSQVDAISPVSAIGGIPAEVPVLILAGGADRMARAHESRALFDRVRSHGRLEIFEGADHVRLLNTAPDRYRRAVLELVESLRRSPGD